MKVGQPGCFKSFSVMSSSSSPDWLERLDQALGEAERQAIDQSVLPLLHRTLEHSLNRVISLLGVHRRPAKRLKTSLSPRRHRHHHHPEIPPTPELPEADSYVEDEDTDSDPESPLEVKPVAENNRPRVVSVPWIEPEKRAIMSWVEEQGEGKWKELLGQRPDVFQPAHRNIDKIRDQYRRLKRKRPADVDLTQIKL